MLFDDATGAHQSTMALPVDQLTPEAVRKKVEAKRAEMLKWQQRLAQGASASAPASVQPATTGVQGAQVSRPAVSEAAVPEHINSAGLDEIPWWRRKETPWRYRTDERRPDDPETFARMAVEMSSKIVEEPGQPAKLHLDKAAHWVLGVALYGRTNWAGLNIPSTRSGAVAGKLRINIPWIERTLGPDSGLAMAAKRNLETLAQQLRDVAKKNGVYGVPVIAEELPAEGYQDVVKHEMIAHGGQRVLGDDAEDMGAHFDRRTMIEEPLTFKAINTLQSTKGYGEMTTGQAIAEIAAHIITGERAATGLSRDEAFKWIDTYRRAIIKKLGQERYDNPPELAKAYVKEIEQFLAQHSASTESSAQEPPVSRETVRKAATNLRNRGQGGAQEGFHGSVGRSGGSKSTFFANVVAAQLPTKKAVNEPQLPRGVQAQATAHKRARERKVRGQLISQYLSTTRNKKQFFRQLPRVAQLIVEPAW